MPLVLLCSILNLSNFSWYKETLYISLLVCNFSLLAHFFFSFILALFFLTFPISFLHLHVQPFLFLFYLMISFYVPNKLCLLRVKLPLTVFHSQRRLWSLTCKEISQIMPERARFSQRGRGKGQKLTRKFRWKSCSTMNLPPSNPTILRAFPTTFPS